MELTSSKLRLASVSSEEAGAKRFRLGKRQIIFVVLFVVFAAASGFLVGYFVKGNKPANDNCGSNGNQTNHHHNQPEVSEIFSKFEDEVSTEELRENLR